MVVCCRRFVEEDIEKLNNREREREGGEEEKGATCWISFGQPASQSAIQSRKKPTDESEPSRRRSSAAAAVNEDSL